MRASPAATSRVEPGCSRSALPLAQRGPRPVQAGAGPGSRTWPQQGRLVTSRAGPHPELDEYRRR